MISLMSGSRFWVYLAGLGILAAVMLPAFSNYTFVNDYALMRHVEVLDAHLLAGFQPNFSGRNSPFLHYFIWFEKNVFAAEPRPYFATLYILHFLNVLLLVKLYRRLGGVGSGEIAGGLLFLFSSSFSHVLISLENVHRVLCLLMMLLGTHRWISYLDNKRIWSFFQVMILMVLAILAVEDGMVFPLVALLFTFYEVRDSAQRRRVLLGPWLVLTAVQALVCLYLTLPYLLSFRSSWEFTGEFPFFYRLLNLARCLVQPLLVPAKGLVAGYPMSETLLRLLPAIVLISVFVWAFSRGRMLMNLWEGLPKSLLLLGLGWTIMTALPFFSYTVSFEHANRQLYVPMAGFTIFLAAGGGHLYEVARKYYGDRVRWFCLTTLVYILVIQLAGVVLDYDRYTGWVYERDFQRVQDVRSLFR